MKKLLNLTSSLILSSSGIMTLTNNISNYQTASTSNETNSNQTIDWKVLEETTTTYFKNIKKNYQHLEINSLKTIEFAYEKANEYIKKFKKENYNLKQIQNQLSQQIPQFAKNYDKFSIQNNYVLHNNDLLLAKKIEVLNSSTDFESLEKYVNDLKIAKTTFITVSATAAVAAAGFWAAVTPSIGLSVSWALGCTSASALAGGIDIALVKYNNELSKLNKATMTFGAVYKLGHIFYSVLNPLLIGATATATALSWAFPGILAIIPVTSSILAWINLFS